MPGYYNRTHVLLRKQEKKNKNFDNEDMSCFYRVFTPFWGIYDFLR